MTWGADRDRVLRNLTRPVLERPLPPPKEQQSFSGLKVGQRLRRIGTEIEATLTRATNQFAELTGPNGVERITHGWEGTWEKVKATRKKGKTNDAHQNV